MRSLTATTRSNTFWQVQWQLVGLGLAAAVRSALITRSDLTPHPLVIRIKKGTVKFASMAEVCRTCLQPVTDASDMYYLDAPEPNLETLTLGQKLTACVPELMELPSLRAALCWSCTTALRCAYGFRQQCLETEQRIAGFLQRSGRDSVDSLVEVVEIGPNSYAGSAAADECIDIEQLGCLTTEAGHGSHLSSIPSCAVGAQMEPLYSGASEQQETVVVELLSSPPSGNDVEAEQDCPSVGYYQETFNLTAMRNDAMETKCADRNRMPASPNLLLQELLKEHTYYCSRCSYSTKKINRYQLHKRVHLAQKQNY